MAVTGREGIRLTMATTAYNAQQEAERLQAEAAQAAERAAQAQRAAVEAQQRAEQERETRFKDWSRLTLATIDQEIADTDAASAAAKQAFYAAAEEGDFAGCLQRYRAWMEAVARLNAVNHRARNAYARLHPGIEKYATVRQMPVFATVFKEATERYSATMRARLEAEYQAEHAAVSEGR